MCAWRMAFARVAATLCRHSLTFGCEGTGGWAPPGVTHADAVVRFVVDAENASAASAIAATVIACFRVCGPPLGDRSGLPREWNSPLRAAGAGGAHGEVVPRRCL